MPTVVKSFQAWCFGLALLLASSAGLVLGCMSPRLVNPCKFKSLVGVSEATNPGLLPALNTSLNKDEVFAHYEYQTPFQYANHLKSVFACVDAREDSEVFGTPGGDFAEFVMAAHVYFKLVQKMTFTEKEDERSEELIDTLFNAFVSENMSPERPFYYHTDEIKLGHLYEAVAERGVVPAPTILPATEPRNATEAAIWYEEWAQVPFQGCGHIRLMLQNYSSYGLDSKFIPEAMLRSFLRYWWRHPHGSEARAKINPWFKLNKLAGRAVTIINPVGNCPGYSPMVAGNKAASSVFIYHAAAVKDWRAKVVVPWFAKFDYRVDSNAFLKELNALADTMLKATLTLLPPANNVPIFTVTIEGQALTANEFNDLKEATYGAPAPATIINDYSGISKGAAGGIAVAAFCGGVLLSTLVVIVLNLLKLTPTAPDLPKSPQKKGATSKEVIISVDGEVEPKRIHG